MFARHHFAAILVAVICTPGAHAQEKKILMTPVKYDGLKEEVLKHRGKVVIVDFWASTCINCMKAFPTFEKMHNQYADKGLVIITVSVDPLADEVKINAANGFLTKRNPPFRHFLLDAPVDEWTKKLDFSALPCYYLFDRRGKWVRFRAQDAEVNYDALEKTVVQMLNEK